MKNLLSITLLIWFSLILGACDFTPQSKSAYFEKYEVFMDEVKQKEGVISAEKWIEFDKKHNQFSVDFFQKFKKEMLLEEKAKARKLGANYQILRTKAKLKDILQFKSE